MSRNQRPRWPAPAVFCPKIRTRPLRRDWLLERLPAIGFERLAPADGAFYLYADVGKWTTDSLSWCARMLAETGVALAPGVDFDPVDGGRFVGLKAASLPSDSDRKRGNPAGSASAGFFSTW